MKLSEFIIESIQQIKNGIDKANEKSPDYKVLYPNEMILEISLDANGELARKKEQQTISSKITLNLAHYPWNKQ